MFFKFPNVSHLINFDNWWSPIARHSTKDSLNKGAEGGVKEGGVKEEDAKDEDVKQNDIKEDDCSVKSLKDLVNCSELFINY